MRPASANPLARSRQEYYLPCLGSNPESFCRQYLDWATLEARVLDSAHPTADAPLNWLWVDHQVASRPPEFYGIDQPAVKGCTDVDLNFSPSTNLLPIRRLNLNIGNQAPVSAAWLRFPSFTLERLDQIYSRVDDQTYRYESNRGGKFVVELKTNDIGLVISYPGLWEEERG